jgi:hypothetical protein
VLDPVVEVESAVSIERAFKGIVEDITTVEVVAGLVPTKLGEQTPQSVVGMSAKNPS